MRRKYRPDRFERRHDRRYPDMPYHRALRRPGAKIIKSRLLADDWGCGELDEAHMHSLMTYINHHWRTLSRVESANEMVIACVADYCIGRRLGLDESILEYDEARMRELIRRVKTANKRSSTPSQGALL